MCKRNRFFTFYDNPLQRVKFVTIFSTIISITALLYAFCYMVNTGTKRYAYNSHPVLALNFTFSMVTIGLCSYQSIVSIMLLIQLFKEKYHDFLCSVWLVSHVSIWPINCFFLVSDILLNIYVQNWSAYVIIVLGCLYQGIFIWFCDIVYKYLKKLYQGSGGPKASLCVAKDSDHDVGRQAIIPEHVNLEDVDAAAPSWLQRQESPVILVATTGCNSRFKNYCEDRLCSLLCQNK